MLNFNELYIVIGEGLIIKLNGFLNDSMSSFFLSSQPTVSSQEAASPSIRLVYSSHSVVTLDTLSLVASWWPVMIEIVELLKKISHFCKSKFKCHLPRPSGSDTHDTRPGL